MRTLETKTIKQLVFLITEDLKLIGKIYILVDDKAHQVWVSEDKIRIRRTPHEEYCSYSLDSNTFHDIISQILL